MSEQLKTMSEIGLVPLVVLEDAACAKPLGEALVTGGIPVAEVTFRTDACLDIIRAMKEIPTLIVGAGTVHTREQAEAAVKAGATFIVTPAYNPAVIEWCLAHKIDIIPGTVSPAEVEAARAYGIRLCKFFPAAAYGGTATLKALAGPFADVRFLPTGGVSLENMCDYLALSNVAAIGGSFMTPDKLVQARDWDGIAAVCRDAVQRMLGFRVGHIGIHAENRTEAETITDALCHLMGTAKITTGGGFFAGSFAEICAGSVPGELGHICIDTHDMPRALAYYARRGIALNPEHTFRDEKGDVRLAYLAETAGGFSIHLRRV
ncbi:hypothetical protein TAMA11512_15100 [Selenomonas sp. TAMA-11512]|uniref:bifunctional 4-hydroxy-2-oxoglutarate aldolase/2-dehydro-3-deoxy-phosphogluconate aldolase n=1 Tax=Selenomonas sp. TAMA-11512 TaxID=3095337 RepID=UPI00308EE1F7|nr:hypothetical protein TAMA11512_15100 [Selenomonas sp. TAMA-11512]